MTTPSLPSASRTSTQTHNSPNIKSHPSVQRLLTHANKTASTIRDYILTLSIKRLLTLTRTSSFPIWLKLIELQKAEKAVYTALNNENLEPPIRKTERKMVLRELRELRKFRRNVKWVTVDSFLADPLLRPLRMIGDFLEGREGTRDLLLWEYDLWLECWERGAGKEEGRNYEEESGKGKGGK